MEYNFKNGIPKMGDNALIDMISSVSFSERIFRKGDPYYKAVIEAISQLNYHNFEGFSMYTNGKYSYSIRAKMVFINDTTCTITVTQRNNKTKTVRAVEINH